MHGKGSFLRYGGNTQFGHCKQTLLFCCITPAVSYSRAHGLKDAFEASHTKGTAMPASNTKLQSVSNLTPDELRAIEGRLFNIQPYSIHDGPGIRTTVFINGCPLRCRWCQNPESLTVSTKLFFMKEKCVGCGACAAVCPKKAVSIVDGKAVTDRVLCDACGLCVAPCPVDARSLEGETKTVGEVVDRVLQDKLFLIPSDGGVTVSGGEVLTQPMFVAAILRLCKEAGITTCIETAGFGSWEAFEVILEYCDLVLFDFKNMDDEKHQWGTGVSNQKILENAQRVYHEAKKKMRARVPTIPGYNDSEENFRKMCLFIVNSLGTDVHVHLLPYHTLGESKRDRMEMDEQNRFTAERPSDAHMEELKQLVESYGLSCQIGG